MYIIMHRQPKFKKEPILVYTAEDRENALNRAVEDGYLAENVSFSCEEYYIKNGRLLLIDEKEH